MYLQSRIRVLLVAACAISLSACSAAREPDASGIVQSGTLETATVEAVARVVKVDASTRDVTVKTAPGVEGDRRVVGVLSAVGSDGIVVREEDGSERSLRHDEILKARTVFRWTPEPKSARKGNDRSAEAAPGRKVG